MSAPLEDTELAVAAFKGDSRAFSRLVERYEKPIYTMCLRYLRSSEAEEAAQDTFVKAFTHFKTFDPARPFKPWLYAIARRQCLDRLRRRKFDGPSLDVENEDGPKREVADTEAADPQVAIDAKTALTHLMKLEEGPREALALFHLHELSYQEIADSLEVPMGTVMTWIHRGRASLREALGG